MQPLYDQVVQLGPNYLEGRIAVGSFYGAIDELDKAVEHYSAALAVNPKYDFGDA